MICPLNSVFAEESGFPLPMAEEIIGRLLSDSKNATVLDRLRKKLNHHSVLSRARVWAWVAPGNLPDPIALAVVAAGIKKARLILKLSRQNERTGRALAQALRIPDQKIQITVDARDFKKRSVDADAWIIYGSDTTVQKLHSQAPAGAGHVAHGHRISLSVIFGVSLGKKFAPTVHACARDIWLYDQRGCLSPQIIWVEGKTEDFAAALQKELLRLQEKFGPIRRSPDQQASRRQALEELRVRAIDFGDTIRISGGVEFRIVSPKYPVVYLLKGGRFTTPVTGQIVAVKSFAHSTQILRGMKPFLTHIQGVATAGTSRDRLKVKRLFRNSAAVYFPIVGNLQYPPLDWNL